ncbi:MAG: TaqI-like C-terminal specificity domain-containing protein [Candidatus Cloacimonadota bacterium]|nr:TaqI-like C-terminal specificity domain-containing protein [Candidatus Cloacimonadota bacterium]
MKNLKIRHSYLNAIKYLISLINSKLIDFYFYQISSSLSENAKRHTKQYVELIPIPKISKEDRQPFIKIVDQILSLKKEGKDTQLLEDKIDIMVYKLYALTEEEIKIVEEKT